jgi:hypothetical protein
MAARLPRAMMRFRDAVNRRGKPVGVRPVKYTGKNRVKVVER